MKKTIFNAGRIRAGRLIPATAFAAIIAVSSYLFITGCKKENATNESEKPQPIAVLHPMFEALFVDAAYQQEVLDLLDAHQVQDEMYSIQGINILGKPVEQTFFLAPSDPEVIEFLAIPFSGISPDSIRELFEGGTFIYVYKNAKCGGQSNRVLRPCVPDGNFYSQIEELPKRVCEYDKTSTCTEALMASKYKHWYSKEGCADEDHFNTDIFETSLQCWK